MKLPRPAPSISELLQRLRKGGGTDRVADLLAAGSLADTGERYHHWDTLRHLEPPDRLTPEQWWLGIKFARSQAFREIPLTDLAGRPFRYTMPDSALRMAHEIDRNASGRIQIPEEVTNPSSSHRYIVSSLIEEAITSSQLEGASTTRRVAKEMLRSARKPRNRSEQMILNNYEAMHFIRGFTPEPVTPDRILELHRIVTDETLESDDAAGRLRRTHEAERVRVVDPNDGTVLHVPPPAGELPDRLEKMCDFANGNSPGHFVHPVVRAVALHFWLAYDHPFVDGNGRTARALFYWSMLHEGYWLCEYISISRILRSAPAQYARSFLYTETDEGDLTYFILYQLRVILRAIEELHRYLSRKAREVQETERLIRTSAVLNHRQLALLSHALKHPGGRYTIESHRNSHNVVYQTARSDLLDLTRRGVLEKRQIGRRFHFYPPPDLSDRLQKLEA